MLLCRSYEGELSAVSSSYPRARPSLNPWPSGLGNHLEAVCICGCLCSSYVAGDIRDSETDEKSCCELWKTYKAQSLCKAGHFVINKIPREVPPESGLD